MTAELLREAAALMRERAEHATPGPWFATSSTVEGAGTVFHDPHALHNDGLHISSWHPAVAFAVATWLDTTADMEAALDESCRCWRCAQFKAAAAVANAYLGRTA